MMDDAFITWALAHYGDDLDWIRRNEVSLRATWKSGLAPKPTKPVRTHKVVGRYLEI